MCKVCVKWFHIEGRETCLSLFLTNLVVLEIFFSHPQPSINSRHSLQEKNQGNPAREPTGFLVIRDIGTDLEGVANMLRKIPSKVLRFQEHLRWNHKHMVALVCHQFNNFQRLSSIKWHLENQISNRLFAITSCYLPDLDKKRRWFFPTGMGLATHGFLVCVAWMEQIWTGFALPDN